MAFPIAAYLTCRRTGVMARAVVLVLVAICQMPLPVWHEHGSPENSAERAALDRHIALFHHGNPVCPGPHLHLIPPALWAGGCAEEATAVPGPEVDANQAPLLTPITVEALVSARGPVAATLSIDRSALSRGLLRPAGTVHFLQTFNLAAEIPELLGVYRC